MFRVLSPLTAALTVAAFCAADASAVPCGPTTCAPFSSAVPGSSALLVRPQGQQGPLVAYSLRTGRRGRQLPAGVLSADGRRFVIASPGFDATRVTSFAAATGVRLRSTRFGRSNLQLAAVSADGRYAVLVSGTTDPNVVIADLERARVAWTAHLQGRWDVDAISSDGSRLYLIEYRTAGGYLVRVYDAATGLVPGAITDPREPAPMTGVPWSSSGSRDGRWQLTLYLKPGTNTTDAFVHALSLTGAHAACIDLPGGDFVSVGRYALVLAPDGRTLYAANPSLGVIVTIDLAKQAVVSTVRFSPGPADASTSAGFGAISRDGKMLYFSAGRGLTGFDVGAAAPRGPYGVGAVAGVGFDPSSHTLLVVKRDGSTMRLDAKSGALLHG